MTMNSDGKDNKSEQSERTADICRLGALMEQGDAAKTAAHKTATDGPKAETLQFIPAEERPYYWAFREMKRISMKHTFAKLPALDDMAFDGNIHQSVYHIGEDNKPDILRTSVFDEGKVRYDILQNYYESCAEYPEMMGVLERNGIDEYKLALEKHSRLSEESDEEVYSASLDPVRLPDDDVY